MVTAFPHLFKECTNYLWVATAHRSITHVLNSFLRGRNLLNPEFYSLEVTCTPSGLFTNKKTSLPEMEALHVQGQKTVFQVHFCEKREMAHPNANQGLSTVKARNGSPSS